MGDEKFGATLERIIDFKTKLLPKIELAVNVRQIILRWQISVWESVNWLRSTDSSQSSVDDQTGIGRFLLSNITEVSVDWCIHKVNSNISSYHMNTTSA